MLAIFYCVILLSYVLCVLSVTLVDILYFIDLMIVLAYSISNIALHILIHMGIHIQNELLLLVICCLTKWVISKIDKETYYFCSIFFVCLWTLNIKPFETHIKCYTATIPVQRFTLSPILKILQIYIPIIYVLNLFM